MVDKRWRVAYPQPATHHVGDLRKLHLRPILLRDFREPPPDAFPMPPRRNVDNVVDRDPRIPCVEWMHPDVFGYSLAIAANASDRRFPSCLFGQPDRAGRENEGRGESLDVPLPRRGERFVKIIDVEKNVAL